jgi:hypothetical protein
MILAPDVMMMNPMTMTSSFLDSRWKQDCMTRMSEFVSSRGGQVSKPDFVRQKMRVQSPQGFAGLASTSSVRGTIAEDLPHVHLQ